MENRFEVVKMEQVPTVSGWSEMSVFILRDKQTGVMYVANSWGSSGGLTPLLDPNGIPYVVYEEIKRDGEKDLNERFQGEIESLFPKETEEYRKLKEIAEEIKDEIKNRARGWQESSPFSVVLYCDLKGKGFYDLTEEEDFYNETGIFSSKKSWTHRVITITDNAISYQKQLSIILTEFGIEVGEWVMGVDPTEWYHKFCDDANFNALSPIDKNHPYTVNVLNGSGAIHPRLTVKYSIS